MTYLIVPDNDVSREFVAEDLDEAHGTCYARGYEKFDVWSMPHKREEMALGIYDDGGTMLKTDVVVVRP